MHILQVMLKNTRGGSEQGFVDYCRLAQMAGHQVTAMIHQDCFYKSALKDLNIPWVEVASTAGWSYISRWKARRAAARFKVDVILYHDSRALRVLGTHFPVPTVGVCHAERRLEGLKAVDVIWVFTPALAERAKKMFSDKTVEALPFTLFEDHPAPQVRDTCVVGALGRWTPAKRTDLLLEALFLLKQRGIVLPCLMAGGGPEEKRLRKLVTSLDLSDQVQFLGWVQDKAEFFGAIDVFCVPSRKEAFGLGLLEAMAYGKACVATATLGPSHLLGGGAGLLVPIDDAAGLATALETLFQDKTLRGDLGRQARDVFEKNYAPARAVEALEKALVSLDVRDAP